MSNLKSLSELETAADQDRLDFLRTDLALCSSFADLAGTERKTGDLDAAHRVLNKAETGYATIARFLADVKNADQKHEIAQKLSELRARLDTEQHCQKNPGVSSAGLL